VAANLQLDITSHVIQALDQGVASRTWPAAVGVRAFATVSLQRIANESRLGARYHAEVAALQATLQRDVEAQRTRLDANGVPRPMTSAAEQVAARQTQLQESFQKALLPVLERMRDEAKVDLLFSDTDSGLVVKHPLLDLTARAVQMLDAASK
jgi:hypothetical protein